MDLLIQFTKPLTISGLEESTLEIQTKGDSYEISPSFSAS